MASKTPYIHYLIWLMVILLATAHPANAVEIPYEVEVMEESKLFVHITENQNQKSLRSSVVAEKHYPGDPLPASYHSFRFTCKKYLFHCELVLYD